MQAKALWIEMALQRIAIVISFQNTRSENTIFKGFEGNVNRYQEYTIDTWYTQQQPKISQADPSEISWDVGPSIIWRSSPIHRFLLTSELWMENMDF